jgi:hypothetical protein
LVEEVIRQYASSFRPTIRVTARLISEVITTRQGIWVGLEMKEIIAQCISLSLIAVMLLGIATYVAPVKAVNINVNQDTFVLSNEGPGYGISALVNAGYGNYSLYDTLLAIRADADPSVSSILTDSFLSALGNCPPSSQIFATQLKEVNSPGATVGISTDGTFLTNGVIVGIINFTILTSGDIIGSTYQGTFPTLDTVVSGVGSFRVVYENLSQTVYNPQSGTNQITPLTALRVNGPLAGMTTTYNVFGILFVPITTTSPSPIASSADSSQNPSQSA